MTAHPTIGPTPERLAKAGEDVDVFEYDTSLHFKTIRMLDGSPIERLASIGQRTPAKGITGDQYQAGCRYFGDAYMAGLIPSGVVDTTKERVDGGGHKDMADAVLAAQTRHNRTIKALDHDAYRILEDVVLMECPLTVYADRFREFRQPRERRAIALHLLRKALDQLDAHYYPPRNRRTHSAMAEGARPVIQPSEAM